MIWGYFQLLKIYKAIFLMEDKITCIKDLSTLTGEGCATIFAT